MPPVDLDDPRLTAYALGDLDDPADVAEVEAHLNQNPEARQYVAEICATARVLSEGLRLESTQPLSGAPAANPATVGGEPPARQPDPTEQPTPAPSLAMAPLPPRRARPWAGWGLTAGLAATLLIGAGTLLLWQMTPDTRPLNPRSTSRAPASADLGSLPAEPLPGTALARLEPATVSRLGVPAEGPNDADRGSPSALATPSPPSMTMAAPPTSSDSPRDSAAAEPLPSLGLTDTTVAQAPVAGEPATAADAVESAPPPAAVATAPLPPPPAPAGAAALADQQASLHLARRSQMELARAAPAPATSVPSRERGAGMAVKQGSLSASEAAQQPSPAEYYSLAEGPANTPVPAKPAAEALIAGRSLETRSESELNPQELPKLEARQADEVRLRQPMPMEREQYRRVTDNAFELTRVSPLSTFSIDVDTASYANVRRFLMAQSQLPPPDAVRIEELVNYFPYAYAGPTNDDPFAVHAEVVRCPWNADHRLARIGLKGRELVEAKRPASNLVFLVDVSGSMDEPNKLPLVKEGLRALVNELTENDRVAIVVYASAQGTALDPTRGDRKADILRAIDDLAPGGSTHGSAGIQAAYEMASRNFVADGTNRVILCTDGDFNVGITDDGSLERFIAEKAAESKVFLTVLAFGTGNVQDAKMEGLADKGNGNYHYIDSPREAHKVLVEQIGQTLVTIAKDVKIQVDFNPAKVEAYRLIGYENRILAAQDFQDDKKDAGEIGAGHTVTALYELVPPGARVDMADVEPSRFAQPAEPVANDANESFEVRLRFKPPTGDVSTERKFPVIDDGKDYADASTDTKWAAAVAAFGMILRESPYKGPATLEGVAEQAGAARGDDPGGYRAEFLDMVEKARTLSPPPGVAR